MFSPRNLFFLLVTLCVSFFIRLDALSIDLLEISDDSKKVYFRFCFDQDDSALFKESIKISLDNPFCLIKKWSIHGPVKDRYFPKFRANKRIYGTSCVAEILLERNVLVSPVSFKSFLFSGIMHKKNGKNIPFYKVVPIKKLSDDSFVKRPLFSPWVDVVVSTSTLPSHSLLLQANVFYDDLTTEFRFMEKCSDIWSKIIDQCRAVFSIGSRFWLYVVMVLTIAIFLMLSLFLFWRKKRADQGWPLQAIESLIYLILLSLIPLSRSFFDRNYPQFLACSAMIVFGLGLFCLVTTSDEMFWGRVKLAIALACLCASPLLGTYSFLFWMRFLG